MQRTTFQNSDVLSNVQSTWQSHKLKASMQSKVMDSIVVLLDKSVREKQF